MDDFVEQLKALGDETRIKIIRLLSEAKVDLCVCEIMDAIEDSHCNISRHLKILKTAKLVKESKQGKWVYFSLATPKDPFHESVLHAVSSIMDEHFFNDSKRLKLRLSLREKEKCVDGLKSEKWARALELLATMVPRPDDKNKKREKSYYGEK
ncbi:MAG: metalloregulator ArsR/SmtB family transcription factor [Deltaproteobacteria bacterium]|nr:metalloregulator ArsR/SmtB family transcription factor [Deltaproteobacteria bacterium]